MADLPDWADRWLERQSRIADAIAAVAPLNRIPRAWLIGLAHAAGLSALLAAGVAAHSPLAWAVIAIPMTMIVVLALSGRARSAGAPSAVHARRRAQASRRPFDVQAMGPSVAEPSFDSPIVVARRTQPPGVAEPLIVRRSR